MSGDATNSASVRRQAAEWAQSIEASAMRDDDWIRFAEWMAAPEHETAFISAQGRLRLIDSLPTRSFVGQAPARRRSRAPFLAGGAVFALLGVALVTIWTQPPESSTLVAGSTARDVVLGDHSAVVLRPGSRLAVKMTPHERDVVMEKGSQASFDVAKDPRRPFVIDLGGRAVRVVGTAFDIAYSDKLTRVSVARGVVEVSGRQGEPIRRLTAGNTVSIEGSSPRWVDASVTPENVGAWRRRRLIFSGASLEVVASDISDNSDLKVVAAPRVRNLQFSGVLKLGSASQMAHALEAFLPVRAEVSDGQIVLDRR